MAIAKAITATRAIKKLPLGIEKYALMAFLTRLDDSLI
jgi:hypothetical protein